MTTLQMISYSTHIMLYAPITITIFRALIITKYIMYMFIAFFLLLDCKAQEGRDFLCVSPQCFTFVFFSFLHLYIFSLLLYPYYLGNA